MSEHYISGAGVPRSRPTGRARTLAKRSAAFPPRPALRRVAATHLATEGQGWTRMKSRCPFIRDQLQSTPGSISATRPDEPTFTRIVRPFGALATNPSHPSVRLIGSPNSLMTLESAVPGLIPRARDELL